jgi:Protein of unknown function (DUF4038)/Putative collagen-binding domain of a collagenase/FlgD Ig-like domain
MAQLKVSPGGQYLYEAQTGLPVFLNGESAWCLFTATTYTQADSFFQNCQQYGINFLQTMLPEDGFTDNSPANLNGDTPFTGTYFITPRESYFAHADSIVGLARTYGIYLHIYISYLGSNDGEGVRTKVASASISRMKTWGAYIGGRYRDSTNIMWGISGDCDPSTWQVKIDSMVVGGLLTVDTNHLITPRDEPNTRTQTHWSGRSWLKLEYIYPYWGPQNYNPENIVTLARAIYNSGQAGFLEEAWYENEKYVGDYPTANILRQQMYYPILSGALVGQVFGNGNVWGFDLGDRFWLGPGGYRDWLDSDGHIGTGWCGKLFRSRYWWRLIPDQTQSVITAGYGSLNDSSYVPSAYTSDGSSIIAYLPSSRSVTINPSVLNGDSVRVYWFSPGSGAVTNRGVFSKTSRSYSPPGSGDWVLVMDSKDFAPLFDVPGGNPPSPAPTGVKGEPPPVPLVANLGQNYPNPFNPATTIGYDIPVRSAVALVIFDMAGRKIRTLVQGVRPAGRYSVRWDGKDDTGRSVSSGIYLYDLRAGGIRITKKMLLIK